MSLDRREANAAANADARYTIALGILTVAVGLAIGAIVFAAGFVVSILDWS